MKSHVTTRLSRDGERRREEILRLAEGALGARMRRRRSRQAIAAAVPLLAVVALMSLWPRSGAITSHPRIEIASTGPLDLESLELPYRLEILDDSRLAEELAVLGAGLIQVADQPPRLVLGDGSPYSAPPIAAPGPLDPGSS